MSNIPKNKGGRPQGARTLISVSKYFTEQEKKDFFENLKLRARTNDKIAIYLAEQLSGKAPQAMSLDVGGNLTIKFDNSFNDK